MRFPFYFQDVRIGALLYGVSTRNCASILSATQKMNSAWVAFTHLSPFVIETDN